MNNSRIQFTNHTLIQEPVEEYYDEEDPDSPVQQYRSSSALNETESPCLVIKRNIARAKGRGQESDPAKDRIDVIGIQELEIQDDENTMFKAERDSMLTSELQSIALADTSNRNTIDKDDNRLPGTKQSGFVRNNFFDDSDPVRNYNTANPRNSRPNESNDIEK